MRTWEQLRERIIDRCSQDEVVEVLNVDMEELVEELTNLIWQKRQNFDYLFGDE